MPKFTVEILEPKPTLLTHNDMWRAWRRDATVELERVLTRYADLPRFDPTTERAFRAIETAISRLQSEPKQKPAPVGL
jgi:hypothetical protein